MPKPASADVHPTAVVHAQAQLGSGVTVGPYCGIEEDGEIGAGTGRHAPVGGHRGGGREGRGASGVGVGDRTVFFPHVTVERAHGEGELTRLGPDCFIMTEVHIGHNSVLGQGVTLASGVALGGFSVDEDYVFLGAGAGQHQHVRVGKLAMVGGNVRIIQDVPPFLLTADFDVAAKGLNLVGLKRYGMSADKIAALKRAYKLLYRSKLSLADALERIEKEVATEEARYLVRFIRAAKRGICRE